MWWLCGGVVCGGCVVVRWLLRKWLLSGCECSGPEVALCVWLCAGCEEVVCGGCVRSCFLVQCVSVMNRTVATAV